MGTHDWFRPFILKDVLVALDVLTLAYCTYLWNLGVHVSCKQAQYIPNLSNLCPSYLM